MERELPTKLIARQVVELLSEKNCESMQKAVSVLEAFFANQPDRVSRAYELAWLVVLKRNLAKDKNASAYRKPSPEADWMALRASKALETGNITQAFSLLRSANNSGARTNLCRSVVFQMMRQLEKKDCLTQVCYEETKFGLKGVTTVEVARVRGSGLVVVRNPGSRFDIRSRSWIPEEGRERFDSGRIFLKNLEELKQDVAQGSIEYSKVGSAELSFDRINWSKYLKELCSMHTTEFAAEAA